MVDLPANQVKREKTRHVRPSRKTIVTLASKHHLCNVHCPTQFIPKPRLSRKIASMWLWLQPPTPLNSCRPRGKNGFVLRIQGAADREDRGRGHLCVSLSPGVSPRSSPKRFLEDGSSLLESEMVGRPRRRESEENVFPSPF